mmetsp:Transcript_6526/g.10888  ORF Transcript_6526/g.10888 Transcript_6526/m.10888 type:complete len:196 (-) Transcript_6526:94-681(-)|eukprot:CAMPEP_0197725768 /NCGR_PEP_ID=MMETSP1434-20131217/10513_1 /TAXON_ID=265543 /ORGANISM="Minutocellus polymorphus, Strain CCMP3303" /LENGTH=195 /DNA_ID=CAMNT_0043311425 /DNA_START=36 /DNA_END=623 /DNA_ORIENTATION=+
MKCAILSTLLVGAAAFAPAQTGKASTALSADLTAEVGAQAPLGCFDPLGVLGDPKDGDQEQFDQLRYIELKHGRVAMLAFTGYIVTYAGVRFPGAEDIPAGFAALSVVPGMVWAQMIGTWTMMEMANRDYTGTGEFPGDFRNGIDFGWGKLDEATKKKKRSIEINNGRAAQMGILGLMTHEMMGNIDTLPIIGGH